MLKLSHKIIKFQLPVTEKKTLTILGLEKDKPEILNLIAKSKYIKKKNIFLSNIVQYETEIELQEILNKKVVIDFQDEDGYLINEEYTVLFNGSKNSFIDTIFKENDIEKIKNFITKKFKDNGINLLSYEKNITDMLFINYLKHTQDIDFLMQDDKYIKLFIKDYSKYPSLTEENVNLLIEKNKNNIEKILYANQNANFAKKIKEYFNKNHLKINFNLNPKEYISLDTDHFIKQIQLSLFASIHSYNVLRDMDDIMIQLNIETTENHYMVPKENYDFFISLVQNMIEHVNSEKPLEEFDYSEMISTWNEKKKLNKCININTPSLNPKSKLSPLYKNKI